MSPQHYVLYGLFWFAVNAALAGGCYTYMKTPLWRNANAYAAVGFLIYGFGKALSMVN